MYLYKNILLVDDDIGDLVIYSRALTKLDPSITCHTAENALHGLNLIRTGPPIDLIFADLNMPGMDGFEFLSALKQESAYRGAPCVVWTSSTSEVNRTKAQEHGAAGFIVKPSNLEKMKLILDKTLRGDFSGRA